LKGFRNECWDIGVGHGVLVVLVVELKVLNLEIVLASSVAVEEHELFGGKEFVLEESNIVSCFDFSCV
jgi:hypothetical protein